VLTIDGSYGEGGGQLVRMAVALSALTRRPVQVTDVRAGRRNPGLQPQHITAVGAVAALCGAEVCGLRPGSRELVFLPGTIRGGSFRFDTRTAGSLSLVVQACLPVAVAAPQPVSLRLTGGTDVRSSPPFDYLQGVWLPILRRLGLDVRVRLLKRGYYPRGGGEIEVTVRPSHRPATLGRPHPGGDGTVEGRIHASQLPSDIPRRINRGVRNTLEADGGLLSWPIAIEESACSRFASGGAGGAVVLWAQTGSVLLGASALAEKGRSSERVGADAAGALLAELRAGATMDIHAADQLPVYLLRAERESSYLVCRATGHLRTMAWLLPQFLGGRVELEPEGDLIRVRCIPGTAADEASPAPPEAQPT